MNCSKPFRVDGSGGPSLRQLEDALKQVNAPVLNKPNVTKKQLCNAAKRRGIVPDQMILNEDDMKCALSKDRTLQSLLDDISVYNKNNPNDKISVSHKNKAELCHDVLSKNVMDSRLESLSPVLSRRSMSKVKQCSAPRSDKLNNMSKEDLVLLARQYNDDVNTPERSKIKNVSTLKKADLCKRLIYRNILPEMAMVNSYAPSSSVPSSSAPSSVASSAVPHSIPVHDSPIIPSTVKAVVHSPNVYIPSARRDLSNVDDSKYESEEVLIEKIRVGEAKLKEFNMEYDELKKSMPPPRSFEDEQYYKEQVTKILENINKTELYLKDNRQKLDKIQLEEQLLGRKKRLPGSKKSCKKVGGSWIQPKNRKSHCRRAHSKRK